MDSCHLLYGIKLHLALLMSVASQLHFYHISATLVTAPLMLCFFFDAFASGWHFPQTPHVPQSCCPFSDCFHITSPF